MCLNAILNAIQYKRVSIGAYVLKRNLNWKINLIIEKWFGMFMEYVFVTI